MIIDNDVVLVLDDAGPVVVLLITCGTALIDGCNDGDIVMVGPILLLMSLPFSSEEGDVVNDVTLDEDDTNVVVFDDGLELTLGRVLIDGRREGGLVIVGTIVKEGEIVKEGDVVDDVILDVLIDGSTVGDREYVGGPLLSTPPISKQESVMVPMMMWGLNFEMMPNTMLHQYHQLSIHPPSHWS